MGGLQTLADLWWAGDEGVSGWGKRLCLPSWLQGTVGEILCCSFLPDHISARGQRWSPGFVPGFLIGRKISWGCHFISLDCSERVLASLHQVWDTISERLVILSFVCIPVCSFFLHRVSNRSSLVPHQVLWSQIRCSCGTSWSWGSSGVKPPGQFPRAATGLVPRTGFHMCQQVLQPSSAWSTPRTSLVFTRCCSLVRITCKNPSQVCNQTCRLQGPMGAMAWHGLLLDLNLTSWEIPECTYQACPRIGSQVHWLVLQPHLARPALRPDSNVYQ